MQKDFMIRELPETNQILITAKDKKNYTWLVKELKELEPDAYTKGIDALRRLKE